MKAWLQVLAGSMAMCLAGAASAGAPVKLGFLNWIDYIGDQTLSDFSAETGIGFDYQTFDDIANERARMAKGNSGLDLAVVSIEDLGKPEAAAQFEILDKSKLSNLGNIDPQLSAFMASVDQGNQHGVNWLWGTTGLGFVPAKTAEVLGDAPVDSLDVIFRPELASKLAACGISFLDRPEEMFALALNYLGEDPNAHDEATLRKALRLLRSVRPYVRKFSSDEYMNDLANGDVCVAVGWSGDVFESANRGRDTGVRVDYVVPKEGAALWMDMLVIPRNAPHKDEAMRFIDYILRPQVMADLGAREEYATANRASWPLLPPSLASDPRRFPAAGTMARSYVLKPRDAVTTALQSKLWQEFKDAK